MTVNIRRRPFLGRLLQAPKVFVRHYRAAKGYGDRRSAIVMAARLTWIMIRPLVDESRCRICRDALMPGDGRICPRCQVPVGLVIGVALMAAVTATLILATGCSSRTPPNFVPLKLEPTVWDDPRPMCKDVLLPKPDDKCWICIERDPASSSGAGARSRVTRC